MSTPQSPTLFVTDLDGTLLDTRAQLSDTTRDVLRRLLADGLPFSVATARGLPSMCEILADVPIRLPVVALNGAYIADLAAGEILDVQSFEEVEAAALVHLARSYGLSPVISAHRATGDALRIGPSTNPAMAAYLSTITRDPRLVRTERLLEPGDAVVCITLIDAPAALARLRDAIEAEVPGVIVHLAEDLYFPGWGWLTVSSQRATKGAAVRSWMAHRGLADHRLVVFGDQLNDCSLFEAADHAVAVGNAHPELLALADEVIGPHSEDAVARYIEASVRGARLHGDSA